MPPRRRLAAGLVLVLIAPALAQEAKPVKIEWKFEKDKAFYQTVTTETTRTLKFTGRDVSQKIKQTFFLAWTPAKQEDKNWIVKLQIVGFQMDFDGGSNKVAYDSTKDDKASGSLPDFFKALFDAEFAYTLNAEMQATRVEGRDKAVEALAKANPLQETMVRQVLGEDALKQVADTSFAALPNKEVKKGDIWTRTASLLLGPIGTYETKYTYTDLGADKDANLEKIAVKADMTYKKPSDTRLGFFPFKVNSADLKTTEGSGSIDFRKDRGRAEKWELKLTIKGKLNIDVGGKDTEIEVNETQTTTVTTSDENPVKKK
jgi:Family of unknown function (DUF6263)